MTVVRGRHLARRLLGLLGVAWLIAAASVVWWGTRDAPGPSDAIVVLGAAQYDGHPSPVLKARLDHAIALYRRGLAPILVTTGGRGVGDTTSEAAVGRRYALRAGVPASALLTENFGKSTNESLRNVALLVEERQLTRVILVSDAFHLLRVALLARRYHLRATTSPVRMSPIAANKAETIGYILSESIKVPLTLIASAIDP